MIFESLTARANDCALGSHHVIDTKRDAVRVAEIEFAQIAVQMLFVAVLINAFHATLENAVKPFDCVGMDNATAIFFCAMIHAFMSGKLAADCLVMAPFVSH